MINGYKYRIKRLQPHPTRAYEWYMCVIGVLRLGDIGQYISKCEGFYVWPQVPLWYFQSLNPRPSAYGKRHFGTGKSTNAFWHSRP